MKLAKTFLAIGIAILFTVFIAYSLFTIYEPPKYYERGMNECYEQYDCDQFVEECQNLTEIDEGEIPRPSKYDNCYNEALNNPEYVSCLENEDKCEENFNKTTPNYKHAKISFFILLIISIISIVIGMRLKHLEGIGSGFLGGGVLLILWALMYTGDYWFTLSKYMKLIALGLVLVILIYLGYKRLDKK
ncbi:hypothetical protein K8R47_02850 [archaeon]|nr:hypothetical protein [archaeon]